MYLSDMPIFLPIDFVEKEKHIRYNFKQRQIELNDRINNVFSKGCL